MALLKKNVATLSCGWPCSSLALRRVGCLPVPPH